MQDDISAIRSHLSDLAERSYARGIWTFSDFLDLNGQSILLSSGISSPFHLTGGADGTERKIAAFGSEELCGYTETPPIACIHVFPLSAKFAEELSHRDVLGALMSLGIKREVLGDILICGSDIYILCLEHIASHIASELISIRRTSVSCEISDSVPDDLVPELSEKSITVSSPRLDGIISALYSLSRSEGQELFTQRKIFVNGKLCSKSSSEPKAGDIVSIRGRGRFIFSGISGETKKGRIRITVSVYSGRHIRKQEE